MLNSNKQERTLPACGVLLRNQHLKSVAVQSLVDACLQSACTVVCGTGMKGQSVMGQSIAHRQREIGKWWVEKVEKVEKGKRARANECV